MKTGGTVGEITYNGFSMFNILKQEETEILFLGAALYFAQREEIISMIA